MQLVIKINIMSWYSFSSFIFIEKNEENSLIPLSLFYSIGLFLVIMSLQIIKRHTLILKSIELFCQNNLHFISHYNVRNEDEDSYVMKICFIRLRLQIAYSIYCK